METNSEDAIHKLRMKLNEAVLLIYILLKLFSLGYFKYLLFKQAINQYDTAVNDDDIIGDPAEMFKHNDDVLSNDISLFMLRSNTQYNKTLLIRIRL